MQNGQLTTDNGKPRLKLGSIDGCRLAAGFLSVALSEGWDEEDERQIPPRVPFGHPGLFIRHPLRGLGGQVIDGKSVLPWQF
jgi:hypothetical protein